MRKFLSLIIGGFCIGIILGALGMRITEPIFWFTAIPANIILVVVVNMYENGRS